MKFWEMTPYFAYVVVWGTWGLSGGMTVPALDLASLLEEALPAVVGRTAEKGGLCAYVPGVDAAAVIAIGKRLALLQEVEGRGLP